MAPRVSTLAAVAGCLAISEAVSFNSVGTQFLAAKLQPEATARALVPVEDEWSQQAQMYADCVEQQESSNATADVAACDAAPQAFGRSCDTVVKAVVRGSSGDQEAVHQYLDEVCGQDALSGWKKGYCQWFAAEIDHAMSVDSYENRERLKIGELCQSFWQRMLKEDKVRRVDEKEERIAELKAKAAAEEERKVVGPVQEDKKEQGSWKGRYGGGYAAEGLHLTKDPQAHEATNVATSNATTVEVETAKVVAPAVALEATNATQPVAPAVSTPVHNGTAPVKNETVRSK